MSTLLTTNLDQSTAQPIQAQPIQTVRTATKSTVPGLVLARMQAYAELTHLPFLCVEADTGNVLAKTDEGFLEILPDLVLSTLASTTDARIVEIASGLIHYALPLPEIDGLKSVAVGYVLSRPDEAPQDVVLAAAGHGWSQARLEGWLSQQRICETQVLQSLLTMAVKLATQNDHETELQFQIEDLGNQIEHTYEEISLLHSLTSNLQISRSPVDLAELCLSRMEGLIEAEGHAIWLEEANDGSHFLVQGEIPGDETVLAKLVSRFEEHNWSKPLVKNNIKGTLLGWDFPGLRNFALVAIAEGEHRSGWILNCNLKEGQDFGTVEASLLNSIATILGTHLRNIDLYQQHEELLLSFVTSLVSTLDAKDPYTRGHSERVALIARRLGEEVNLPEEDLETIYQSGLLHDIGKIGVDDRILQKTGKLTDDEFEKIKEHPTIGYNILSGLTNLQNVLPGVRSHHENYGGKGYPDGLVGEEIPLMARILAVADGYDAMGSDRPYRKGLPLEKVEGIFRHGSGKQWDAKVIDAYFTARDDIIRICEEYSESNRNLMERALARAIPDSD